MEYKDIKPGTLLTYDTGKYEKYIIYYYITEVDSLGTIGAYFGYNKYDKFLQIFKNKYFSKSFFTGEEENSFLGEMTAVELKDLIKLIFNILKIYHEK